MIERKRLSNPPRPQGRKKGVSKNIATFDQKVRLSQICKAYAQKAFNQLTSIIEDPTVQAGTRVQAIGMVLDRGYGRPCQAHQHDIVSQSVVAGIQITPDQFMKLDSDELEKLESILIKLGGSADGAASGESSPTTEEERADAEAYASTLH